MSLYDDIARNMPKIHHWECDVCGRTNGDKNDACHPVELGAMLSGERPYPHCCGQMMRLVTVNEVER